MDNRLLIGFGAFLVVFLAFPFMAQMMKGGDAGGDASTSTTQVDLTPKTGPASIPKDPPLLNQMNIVGSEWQVIFENYKIKITMRENGVCYATHPLLKSVTGMDYFEGRWSMSYDRMTVEARFNDQYFFRELVISGNDLYDAESGTKIERFM
jgi:hypothetical protein